MTLSKGYETGFDAYFEDASNPYREGTVEYIAWIYGWGKASKMEEHDSQDVIPDDSDYDMYDEIDFEDEPEPLEINANDFDIPDNKHPNFED